MGNEVILIPAFLTLLESDSWAGASNRACSGNCNTACQNDRCISCEACECNDEKDQCSSCVGSCNTACQIDRCISCEACECNDEKDQCSTCQSCQSACEISIQNPSSASLSLSGGKGTLRWTISDLGNPFNTSNYIRVGITSHKFTVGGVSSISGIEDYRNASSGGSSTTVSKTIDYEPGTYTFWGFAETPRAGYWPAGSATVTVLPAFADFDWDYAGRNPDSGALVSGAQKRSGLEIYVTAAEWNRLTDTVNGKVGTSFGRVNRGASISASVVNSVARVLGVSTVSAGTTPISASFFNQLRAAINSV